MQIERKVELYLQVCGEIHMGTDSYRPIQPGDICWLIVRPHWPIIKDICQTVTLNGNFLILEVWDETVERDENPRLVEYLSINTPLKTLHLRLADMADKASRDFIASLVEIRYWNEITFEDKDHKDVENFLAGTRSERRVEARELIDRLQSGIEKLKEAIAKQASIDTLISLDQELDKITRNLNHLRHS